MSILQYLLNTISSDGIHGDLYDDFYYGYHYSYHSHNNIRTSFPALAEASPTPVMNGKTSSVMPAAPQGEKETPSGGDDDDDDVIEIDVSDSTDESKNGPLMNIPSHSQLYITNMPGESESSVLDTIIKNGYGIANPPDVKNSIPLSATVSKDAAKQRYIFVRGGGPYSGDFGGRQYIKGSSGRAPSNMLDAGKPGIWKPKTLPNGDPLLGKSAAEEKLNRELHPNMNPNDPAAEDDDKNADGRLLKQIEAKQKSIQKASQKLLKYYTKLSSPDLNNKSNNKSSSSKHMDKEMFNLSQAVNGNSIGTSNGTTEASNKFSEFKSSSEYLDNIHKDRLKALQLEIQYEKKQKERNTEIDTDLADMEYFGPTHEEISRKKALWRKAKAHPNSLTAEDITELLNDVDKKNCDLNPECESKSPANTDMEGHSLDHQEGRESERTIDDEPVDSMGRPVLVPKTFKFNIDESAFENTRTNPDGEVAGGPKGGSIRYYVDGQRELEEQMSGKESNAKNQRMDEAEKMYLKNLRAQEAILTDPNKTDTAALNEALDDDADEPDTISVDELDENGNPIPNQNREDDSTNVDDYNSGDLLEEDSNNIPMRVINPYTHEIEAVTKNKGSGEGNNSLIIKHEMVPENRSVVGGYCNGPSCGINGVIGYTRDQEMVRISSNGEKHMIVNPKNTMLEEHYKELAEEGFGSGGKKFDDPVGAGEDEIKAVTEALSRIEMAKAGSVTGSDMDGRDMDPDDMDGNDLSDTSTREGKFNLNEF